MSSSKLRSRDRRHLKKRLLSLTPYLISTSPHCAPSLNKVRLHIIYHAHDGVDGFGQIQLRFSFFIAICVLIWKGYKLG